MWRNARRQGLHFAAAALTANGVSLVKDVHDTPWRTREFVIKDDQGHICTSVKEAEYRRLP